MTDKGRVTIEDLETAAEWLDVYEHDGSEGYNEAEGCYRVAEWLRQEVQRRLNANAVESAVRRITKLHPNANKRYIRRRVRAQLKS